ncbi:MAG: hypothetical protein QF486_05920 [Candidatus Woesearchaeota archaeon]|jgi:hypothetical protein|nr:hypothetical protein [Candidatus Woesearchaeota archaeon]MDP7467615.1 hypothetical protein [Candidatus Woesearchaeota archaeon]MDP7647097.1 hypothetical protein [Candidatus Woesearchaeota archaeon]
MATLLDIGLLKGLSGIFPLLLIFAVMYAVLTRLDFFKEKQVLAAIISIVLAFTGLFSPLVAKTIMRASPFFVLVFIFSVFAIMVYGAFGIEQSSMISTITGEKWGSTFGLWMLALILIISIGSFSSVLSEEQGFLDLTEGNQSVNVGAAGSEQAGFFSVVSHPKVLGMILVLLTATFTVKYLTDSS